MLSKMFFIKSNIVSFAACGVVVALMVSPAFAEEVSTSPKVRLTLENQAAAGHGAFRIFVHDEKRHRLRYMDLQETQPGKFSADLARFSEIDFETWRVGVPSTGQVRYLPFHCRLESDGSYTMELYSGKTSRAEYWRRSSDQTVAQLAQQDSSPWLKIVLKTDGDRSIEKSNLFVYNGLTSKVSYIELRKDGDDRLTTEFQVSHLSEPAIRSYRISIPSNDETKYFSFEYYIADPRHAEIHLHSKPQLVGRDSARLHAERTKR